MNTNHVQNYYYYFHKQDEASLLHPQNILKNSRGLLI